MATPAGPYSLYREVGNIISVSGQIGIDDEKNLVSEEFSIQAKQALANLGDVLALAGLEYSDVFKTTLFVTDISTFPEMNEIYLQTFSEPLPARSTVCVAALPLGAQFEIEAWAEAKS